MDVEKLWWKSNRKFILKFITQNWEEKLGDEKKKSNAIKNSTKPHDTDRIECKIRKFFHWIYTHTHTWYIIRLIDVHWQNSIELFFDNSIFMPTQIRGIIIDVSTFSMHCNSIIFNEKPSDNAIFQMNRIVFYFSNYKYDIVNYDSKKWPKELFCFSMKLSHFLLHTKNKQTLWAVFERFTFRCQRLRMQYQRFGYREIRII